MNYKLFSNLNQDQIRIVNSIKNHASTLLDNTPRFKYFTLHGEQHIKNLFTIIDILIEGGLELNSSQSFLLACAICTHDIGMVTPLSKLDNETIFGGVPQPADPSKIEVFIRNIHHELIDQYIDQHFDFLVSLGLNAGQCAIIKSISKCHRKVSLTEQSGHVSSLGALLRVIDELDLYPSRAPLAILMDQYLDMDATSCWHWYKHNICQEWMIGHNVIFERGNINKIIFNIAIHPPQEKSIPYWLTQIRKPISKEIIDEGAGKILIDEFNMRVHIKESEDLSSASSLGPKWIDIEQKSLSANRKLILVIDDEVRKMEDLFLPLMNKYHVMFAPNAKDGLTKLNAAKIDLAIVDLQVGSGFNWTPEETSNYKLTGIKVCEEINLNHPLTKFGILTGSRHDIKEVENIPNLEFLLRKPIDPEKFEKEICNVLG